MAKEKSLCLNHLNRDNNTFPSHPPGIVQLNEVTWELWLQMPVNTVPVSLPQGSCPSSYAG